MKVNDDLSVVTCSVEVPFDQYLPFVDRAVIEPKLTKEATDSLLSQGIKIRAARTPSMRGAGGEAFIELIKKLLEAKAYVKLLALLLSRAFDGIKKLINKRYKKLLPQMILCLSISTQEYANEENFYDDLSLRLKQLNIMARTEADRLARLYPIYKFGTVIVVGMNQNGFSARYYEDGSISSRNHQRLTLAIDRLEFQEGLSVKVMILGNGIIKHECSYSTKVLNSPWHDHDWRLVELHTKNYYTLLLGKLSKGYARKTYVIEAAEYKKKYLNSTSSDTRGKNH